MVSEGYIDVLVCIDGIYIYIYIYICISTDCQSASLNMSCLFFSANQCYKCGSLVVI